MKIELSNKSAIIVSAVSLAFAVSTTSFAVSEATGTTHLLTTAMTNNAYTNAVCKVGATGNVGLNGTNGETGTAGTPGKTGATGACGPAGAKGADAQWSAVSADVIPTEDNKFTLGTLDKRWKSLQLGPGTLYIQDQVTGAQAGLTVNSGSLLLDGADSLRIGNVQLTKTGIKSILSNEDITIGNLGDRGYLTLARALKFPDGTTQSTAMLNGLSGPQGPQGAQGPQGITGEAGPKGDTGATGPQGQAGVAVNMKGSFPTMAAFRSAALVGNPGDAWIIVADGSLMVWNSLSLSWDDVGDLQGPQGLQGPKGDTGPQGPQCLQGPQGAKGETGTAGIQGLQGIQGVKGDTGAQGPAGTIAPYGKQYVCVVPSGAKRVMYWGTCSSQGLSGTEYYILATFPY